MEGVASFPCNAICTDTHYIISRFSSKYCSCLLFYGQISSPPLYFSFVVASFETASEIAFLKRFEKVLGVMIFI